MNKILIRQLPKEERPRERLIKYGARNLSTEDLIAIILKTGTKDYSSKYLAVQVLNRLNDISDLKNITLGNLIKIDGIGAVKAIELIAAIELGRRVYNDKKLDINLQFNSSEKIYNYFKYEFKGLKQECFYCLYLDQHKRLIDKKLLFKGTLNRSTVHPREIFKWAYLNSSAYIICVHNHPTDNVIPSNEDIKTTDALVTIGKVQGIPVIDHIIIGNNNYFSFYDEGMISNNKL